MKSTFLQNDILRVERLWVNAVHGGARRTIIHDAAFSVRAGEVFSIVGASGCGKTTLACALTRLLPARDMHVEGTALFGDTDLLGLSESGLRAVLRSDIRYVFQEPGQSLNPIARISAQLRFALGDDPSHERRYRDMCSRFGLDAQPGLDASYPHELSIGTLQRILLAMALAPGPRLLIADEPTSAIDSLVKYQMMDALKQLSREEGVAVVFITHDLVLAERYADRIAVMADGRLAISVPAA